MSELVSIIVPIYNVEDFLPRCLDSIVDQSYKNLEIILVDDGSTDKSGSICDLYSHKDSRIIVIHKQNGGLSEARNFGLDTISGRFVFFLDSDDCIHRKCIEIMMYVQKKINANIVIADYAVFTMENSIELNRELFGVDESITILDKCAVAKNNFYMVCSKLYSSDLWEHCRFPKGRAHEDEFVFHHITHQARVIGYLPIELYFYFQRQDSIMHTISYKQVKDAIDAYIDRISYSKSNWNELLPITRNVFSWYIIKQFFNNKNLTWFERCRIYYIWKKNVKGINIMQESRQIREFYLSPILYKIFELLAVVIK